MWRLFYPPDFNDFNASNYFNSLLFHIENTVSFWQISSYQKDMYSLIHYFIELPPL